MREDFCAFILTHGRPDRVHTFETLRKAGYTGRVYIVIDNEDKTAEEYRRRFGDIVLQFDKAAIAQTFDEGDNFNDRRAIIYARNACWSLAKEVGARYFIELDDDYTTFEYRTNSAGDYVFQPVTKTIEHVFDAMVDFLEDSGAVTVALSQGGDHIGGKGYGDMRFLRRKAMNSLVCCVDRPFQFFGRINEDVNTYTTLGRRGSLFFTVMQAKLNQKQTQANAGGMTDLYLDSGTYVKSFYSVMYCPSSVRVGDMGDPPGSDTSRIHHAINWHKTAPMILRERHKRVNP